MLFIFQFSNPDMPGYVGFANLPNQIHRKSVKRGFEFTLMVVGKLIFSWGICRYKFCRSSWVVCLEKHHYGCSYALFLHKLSDTLAYLVQFFSSLLVYLSSTIFFFCSFHVVNRETFISTLKYDVDKWYYQVVGG